jgi:hypothetical protein
MDELGLRVRNEVYDAFVREGRAPTAAETAEALGLAPEEVEAVFSRLHDAHALVLQPGSREIRMLNPFSAVETPHRVEAGGRTWFANCAWDALGIPAALHADGLVESRCPDCGEPLELQVRDGELVRGAELLVHFVVPATALVGRHRLHLKHDGLPPVGGAPAQLARGDRPGARRQPDRADAARARPALVVDAARARLAAAHACRVAGDPRRARPQGRVLASGLILIVSSTARLTGDLGS